MAEFFSDYGLFLAKTLTVVFAVLFLMAAMVSNTMKARKEMEKGRLTVTHLNKELDKLRDAVRKAVVDRHLLKREGRREKKRRKEEEKTRKLSAKSSTGDGARKRVYVLDFEGDIRASQVGDLARAVTAVLSMARLDKDEIVVRLESPGGAVHGYGLAASQLKRIRDKGIPLTVCVDKVAASGGYMMACLGNRLLAAPFAWIGSIGVVMQLPNFHRLLEEKNIDYEMITAGEYKRTLTLFGENTDKGREKAFQDIQEAHGLFKNFVGEFRPDLNVETVATGEIWLGSKAMEKGLVDEIKTSDEYLVDACESADVYAVKYEHRKKIGERLSLALEKAMNNGFLNWLRKTGENRFF